MPIVNVRSDPWLTAGALRFLTSWIQPHHKVLELGGGASTVWFSKHCAEIVSYDPDANWLAIVKSLANPSCKLTQHQWMADAMWNGEDIPGKLLETYGPDSFDLVLVDVGLEKQRQDGMRQGIPLVRHGGVLMADNADSGWVFPIRPEIHDMIPDWNYTYSAAFHLDKFQFGGNGWATEWWERPPLEQEAGQWLLGEY